MIEVLKLALEALEYRALGATSGGKDLDDRAITAIKQAIAELESQEHVACERCKQLEEHAYDLVGKLRVANIKLSMTKEKTA